MTDSRDGRSAHVAASVYVCETVRARARVLWTECLAWNMQVNTDNFWRTESQARALAPIIRQHDDAYVRAYGFNDI